MCAASEGGIRHPALERALRLGGGARDDPRSVGGARANAFRATPHHRARGARRRLGSDRARDAAGARSARASSATPIVENIPGAAGTIGLARFIGAERGNGDVLLVSGLIMLGGIVTHDSPVTLTDATPIARLTGEYEVIAVPTASPFRDARRPARRVHEPIRSRSRGAAAPPAAATRFSPDSSPTPSASSRGASTTSRSRAAAKSLAAILGGQVSVGINGLAEFAAQIDAGTLRVLAISSAERLPGVDVPTLREQGVDVEFENWRSVVAPPGLTAEERARLGAAVEAMVHSAEWRELLGALPLARPLSRGRRVRGFAAAEERRVRTILRELGTARRRERAPSLSGVRARRARRARRSPRSSTLRRERRARLEAAARSTGARSP